MNEYESLNHTKWECKYHVVFIPKYRRKALYGSLRKHLGKLFRELARQKEWCWVSTVGHNEAAVRKYIQEQEKEDQRRDQLGLFDGQSRFERLQD
jgi:REP element-mobilizing transposase RayT